jgi:hypothetical protein
MTYDGAQLAFYLDGVVQQTQPVSGAIDTDPGPVYIGCDRDNGTGTSPPGQCDNVFLDGELDEVRLETVARSPAWIAYQVAAMQTGAITSWRER